MLIEETCPKCGHQLTGFCYDTYPPQYGKECFNCGWKSEVKQEKIEYQPYKVES